MPIDAPSGITASKAIDKSIGKACDCAKANARREYNSNGKAHPDGNAIRGINTTATANASRRQRIPPYQPNLPPCQH